MKLNEIWVRAFCASVQTGTLEMDSPVYWADLCVEEYKKRFPEPSYGGAMLTGGEDNTARGERDDKRKREVK